MALPVTFSVIATADQNSYHGTFKSSAGNFYAVFPRTATSSLVDVQWASDPTDSFSPADSVFRPDFGAETKSLNTFQDADNLHICGQASDDDVFYARFDTASNDPAPGQWQDVDGGGNTEVLIDGAPNGAADACDIAVLSTGKIRVVYQGAIDMDMGGDFDRIDEANSTDAGVNWNGPNKIDNSDATDAQGLDFTGPRIVLPPSNSDQCHVFMKGLDESNTTALVQVAISSGDTIRTFRDTGVDVTSDLYPITHGIGFTRSSTSKVRIGYREASSNDLAVLEFDAFSDDTDRTETQSDVHADDVQVDNGSINACLSVDGSTIRGLMVKSTNDDLFEFDDGDSDTYTLQSTAHLTGTINHISCNVYDRSGTKLAMIYDDGGTVKYDEIALTAAAPSYPRALFRFKQSPTILRM